jgi:hypothetical protein
MVAEDPYPGSKWDSSVCTLLPCTQRLQQQHADVKDTVRQRPWKQSKWRQAMHGQSTGTYYLQGYWFVLHSSRCIQAGRSAILANLDVPYELLRMTGM